MRFALLSLLQNRSERPTRYPNLENQKSDQQILIQVVAENVRQDQKRRARQTDEHAEDCGPVQPYASWQQRFEAHHPERRNRDDQASQAARNPKLGEYQRSIADSEDQHST